MYHGAVRGGAVATGCGARPPSRFRGAPGCVPGARACSRWPAPRPPHDGGQQVRAFGLTFPGPLGIAAGFDKNAVGHRRPGGGRLQLRRGRHRHRPGPAGERASAAVPPGRPTVRWSTGWASTTTAPPPWPPGSRRRRRRRRRRDLVVGVNIGKTKAVADDERHRRLRAERAAARAVRRLPRRQRELAEHPGTARPAGRRSAAARCWSPFASRPTRRPDGTSRCSSRSPPTCPTTRSWRSPGSRCEVGLDGIVAVNTTVTADGPAQSRRRRSRRPARAVCPGPPLRRRALEVLRLLRQHVGTLPIISVGGVSTADDVLDAAGRRSHPGAGLHGVRLRGACVALAGPARRRDASADLRPMADGSGGALRPVQVEGAGVRRSRRSATTSTSP